MDLGRETYRWRDDSGARGPLVALGVLAIAALVGPRLTNAPGAAIAIPVACAGCACIALFAALMSSFTVSALTLHERGLRISTRWRTRDVPFSEVEGVSLVVSARVRGADLVILTRGRRFRIVEGNATAREIHRRIELGLRGEPAPEDGEGALLHVYDSRSQVKAPIAFVGVSVAWALAAYSSLPHLVTVPVAVAAPFVSVWWANRKGVRVEVHTKGLRLYPRDPFPTASGATPTRFVDWPDVGDVEIDALGMRIRDRDGSLLIADTGHGRKLRELAVAIDRSRLNETRR